MAAESQHVNFLILLFTLLTAEDQVSLCFTWSVIVQLDLFSRHFAHKGSSFWPFTLSLEFSSWKIIMTILLYFQLVSFCIAYRTRSKLLNMTNKTLFITFSLMDLVYRAQAIYKPSFLPWDFSSTVLLSGLFTRSHTCIMRPAGIDHSHFITLWQWVSCLKF